MNVNENYVVIGEDNIRLIALEEISKVYQRLASTRCCDKGDLEVILSRIASFVNFDGTMTFEDALSTVDILSKVYQRIVASSKDSIIAGSEIYKNCIDLVEGSIKQLITLGNPEDVIMDKNNLRLGV